MEKKKEANESIREGIGSLKKKEQQAGRGMEHFEKLGRWFNQGMDLIWRELKATFI